MIRRLFVGGIILVCCGCSTATMHTDVASTKWRMENLEQRFLDFRENAALREADLSTRIAKLEKQLGLPVPSQKELIGSSAKLTSDVHVFTSPRSVHAPKQGMVDDLSSSVSSSRTPKAVTRSSASKKVDAKNSAVEKSLEANPRPAVLAKKKERMSPVPMHKDSVKPSSQPLAASAKSSAKSSRTPSSKRSSSAPVKPAVMASVPPSRKPAPSPVVKKAQTPKSTLASSAPRVVPQSQKRTVRPPVKKTGSTSMYKHALQLLEKGSYIEGRERLEEFLTEFPHDPLTPNAVYWVGESFYSQKDYLIAVDLFREVLRRFPDSSKAQAAMLKIGYSYERLDEFSEARRYLLKVVEKYPKTNEARLARKMLSGI